MSEQKKKVMSVMASAMKAVHEAIELGHKLELPKDVMEVGVELILESAAEAIIDNLHREFMEAQEEASKIAEGMKDGAD